MDFGAFWRAVRDRFSRPLRVLRNELPLTAFAHLLQLFFGAGKGTLVRGLVAEEDIEVREAIVVQPEIFHAVVLVADGAIF